MDLSAPPSTDSEPFTKACECVWKKLTDNEKRNFSKWITIADVYNEVKEIQHKQAETKTLRNLQKIRPYVDLLGKYSSVIEVFVQAKPDVLALIWGPIKLLLHVASNYINCFDKLIDAFDEIGSSLPQLQEIESMFKGNRQFVDYLALLYQEIIEFHLEALVFFRQKRWRIFFDSLWPRQIEKFRKILQNIENHKRLVDRKLSIAIIQEAREMREENLQAHGEYRVAKRIAQLQTCLSPHDNDEYLTQINENYCPDTGQWIFKDQRFQTWAEGSSDEQHGRLLWLTGIPGAGKTYLSASILKYVEEHIGASNPIRVLCALLTHQDSARNTKTSIVQSLIYQICQYDHSFASYVIDQYELRKHRFTGQASFWDQVLEDLLDSQQSTYIILDGLDECSEQQRSGILDIATKIISGCTAVRIMVSSRRVSDIEVSLGEIAQIIEIEDGSREDIKKFVKLKLGEWFKRIKSRAPPGMEKFIRGLEKPIVYKSEGMFLYVKLLLDSLIPRATMEDVEAEADNLPYGLDDIYRRILSQISQSEQAQVKRILSWLVCARRPLKSVELEHAVMIRPGDKIFDRRRSLLRSIVDLCGPIVEVRGEYVTLVHFSAKEFLIKEGENGPYITYSEAQANIYSACLSYLSFRYFDDGIGDEEIDKYIIYGDYVFHGYAQSNWFHHLRLSVGSQKHHLANKLASELRNFLEARWNHSFIPPQTCLQLPNEFRFMESTDKETFEKLRMVATNIWNSAFTFEHSELAENNSNPLVFTSASQRINQRFGALVSSTCTGPNQDLHGTLRRLYSYLYRCPVISCLRHHNGFETAVARDDHMSKVNREFKCTVSSCDFASIGFPTEQELRRHHATFHSRLDSNDPIQATWRDMDQISCVRMLSTAAKAAEPSLVRSLLSLALREQFAINYSDLWEAAATGGSIEVFRSVLDSSPSKEHNKDNRIVALRAAMNCEHLDLVRMMLVDQRFELVHKKRRFSALCHAVERGQEKMLKLLLATRDDMDVNSSDNKWSRKPLFWAIANGHEAVVSLLLTRDDVDPNSKDNGDLTPLARAAYKGHDAVAKLLLARDDVDANSKDNKGRTPLIWAAQEGYEAVAKLLLARDDVDADSKDKDGWTPLARAAQGRHEAVAKLLLARDDVDANSKDKDGWTPLAQAAHKGHEAVAKLLLSRDDVDADSKDNEGWTPLIWAAHKGHEAVVKLLLTRDDVDPNLKDNEGWTPLTWTAHEGHDAVVKLLLARDDVDAHSKNDDGQTPLSIAAKNGHEAVVKLLR